MATISSHVLDSVLGTHAAGIKVQCIRRDSTGRSSVVFETNADEQGRISEKIGLLTDDLPVVVELVFHSRAYFQPNAAKENVPQILDDVVIRLKVPDADGSYHVPMMLSPHSYSVWWSAPAPLNS